VTLFSVRSSSSWGSALYTIRPQQHSQPHRSSFSMAARQSFVLLLMQNQNGLNNGRRPLVKVDKRS